MNDLEFNNKKQCGLWLMLVGAVIVISDILGGNFLINPIIFLIGYYICFFSVNVNKKVREKLSQGPISKFQIKMIYVSLALLFVLMFGIAGPFIHGWNWRLIWLGIFLATAIHFIPWFFIHGRSMVILAVTLFRESEAGLCPSFWTQGSPRRADPGGRHCQVGSIR